MIIKAFFPAGESGLLGWVVWLNPLTYSVDGLRNLLQFSDQAASPPLDGATSQAVCWTVTLLFAAITFALATRIAKTRTTGDLL